MTSIIATIYDKLEAMTVTFADRDSVSKTATVYSQETFPGSLETAHMPARVLMPPTAVIDIEAGGNQQAQWQITDLALLDAAGQGQGPKSHMPAQLRYSAAYQDAIGKLWQMTSGLASENYAVSVAVSVGVFEFPAQSGAWWFGVSNALTITELI